MSYLDPGKMNFTVGLQWGSEAKGKLAAWLALQGEVNMAVVNFSPAAGHTAIYNGKKVISKMLPSSGVFVDIPILLGPDSIINVEQLSKEIEEVGAQGRVFVHPKAAIVSQRHIDWEKEHMGRIGSTMTGGGYCRAERIQRLPTVETADSSDSLKSIADVVDIQSMISTALSDGLKVLGEIPQGHLLGVSSGGFYPYCTSRDVSPATEMGILGINPRLIGQVFGVMRPYPIRVGSLNDAKHVGEDGFSGTFGPDAVELDWPEIEKRSGYPTGSLCELTTVTKRVRRVATLDMNTLNRACYATGCTQISLQFCNYINCKDEGTSAYSELSTDSKAFIEHVEDITGMPISTIGTSADNEGMIGRGRISTTHM